jgi:hypothetical protein
MTKHRIRRSLLLLEVEPPFASKLPSKFSSVVLIPRGSLEIFAAPSARSQVPSLRESILLLTILPEANLNGIEAVVLSSCRVPSRSSQHCLQGAKCRLCKNQVPIKSSEAIKKKHVAFSKLPKVLQKTPKSSTEFRKAPNNELSSDEVKFRRRSLSGLNARFVSCFNHLPFSL